MRLISQPYWSHFCDFEFPRFEIISHRSILRFPASSNNVHPCSKTVCVSCTQSSQLRQKNILMFPMKCSITQDLSSQICLQLMHLNFSEFASVLFSLITWRYPHSLPLLHPSCLLHHLHVLGCLPKQSLVSHFILCKCSVQIFFGCVYLHLSLYLQ